MFEPTIKKRFSLFSFLNARRFRFSFLSAVAVLLLIVAALVYYNSSAQKIIALKSQLKNTDSLLAQLKVSLKKREFKISGNKSAVAGLGEQTQKIGGGVSDVKIKDIRTGSHKGFFRVVFDIEKVGGGEAKGIPATKAVFDPERKSIEIEISGIGGNIQNSPAWHKKARARAGGGIILAYSARAGSEKGSVRYSLFLAKKADFLLDSRLNPARIVVDIK